MVKVFGNCADDRARRPISWVVPGPLRQVTGGYLYDARIVDGLRTRGRPVGVIDLKSGRWPLDPSAGRRLVTALRRARWAAVVADELAHPALAAALLGGGLRRALDVAPLVLLVHHLRCSEPGPLPSRALAYLVERLVARSADLIVCTSETTARTVQPLARRGVPVEVVRPGWDTHEQAELSPPGRLPARGRREHAGGASPAPTGCGSTDAARASLAAPAHLSLALARERGAGGEGRSLRSESEGTLRLLLVGHWTPRKGILEGLAALAQVPAAVTLDLVGEQDRDLSYAAQVWKALRQPSLAGGVRVHGRVEDDVLAGLFANADALILPSTYEGYGMVLAEALAAGLPIVATRVGAVPEVVRDGFEAVLVPPGDVGALARAIHRLASDPDERRRRSELARERARSLPRWAESVVVFESLLRGLSIRPLVGR